MKVTPILQLTALERVLFSELAVATDGARWWVAYSGGLDSTVLLDAMRELAAAHGVPLHALHVNHGLSPQADRWQSFCVERCSEWSIPLVIRRVVLTAAGSVGVEAAARKARYAAFAQLVQTGDYLFLAHHRGDQAETILLNLLRGAGLAGLCGMPSTRSIGAGTLVRPLLGFPRQQIRHYAEARGLAWLDDESNWNTEYDRNYLRHEVVPVLAKKWPACDAKIAQAGVHLREARLLLEEVGAQDLQSVRGTVDDPAHSRLQIEALHGFSAPRLSNVLRCWLREMSVPMPSAAQLRAVEGLVRAASDGQMEWPGGSIHRYRDELWLVPGGSQPTELPAPRSWDLSGPLRIPELNMQLTASRSNGRGLAVTRLTLPLTVRWRHGGERCRLPGRRHHHKLKKLLQAARVPPWMRGHFPILYCGEDIVAVVGLCYCEPFVAGPGEPGWIIEEQPHARFPWTGGSGKL